MAESGNILGGVQFQTPVFPGLDYYKLKDVQKTDDCKRLGTGSFGIVDELYVQGTLCATKQLHESLLGPWPEGVNRVKLRFEKECQIMASIRHPNIVQFLGLHKFPNCSYPTLVMERLAMSLEDLLIAAKNNREGLPFSLKVSILSDTAKGLVYLHNHDPQIIHRDLTSRNILLSLQLQAKITDLGNALIIDSQTVAQTMTTAPGAAVYMPPEAIQSQAKYDFTIDMFSFGILALYTTTEEFPGRLLPATYIQDNVSKKLYARSELERRKAYIESLHEVIGQDHLLTQMIKRCLSNVPDERPTAIETLESLGEMSKSLPHDIYLRHCGATRLDLIKMIESDPHSHKKAMSRGSLRVKELSRPVDCSTNCVTPIDKIEIGVPGNLKLAKSNRLDRGSSKFTRRLTATRRDYTFKISASDTGPNLIYYEEKVKGEVSLASIAEVKASESASEFSFKLVFKGKEDPMKLIAPSKDECENWTKAITRLISPSKQHDMQQKTSDSSKHPDSPDILYHNEAYGYTNSALIRAAPVMYRDKTEMKQVTALHSDQMNVAASTSHNIETDTEYSTIDTPISSKSEFKTQRTFAGENLLVGGLSQSAIVSESSQMKMQTKPLSIDYNKLEHQLGTQPLDAGHSTYKQGTVTTSPVKYQRMILQPDLGDTDALSRALMRPTRKSQTEFSQLSLSLNKDWYDTYQQSQHNQEQSCCDQTLDWENLETKQEKEISIPTVTVDQEPSDDSNQQNMFNKFEEISHASLLVTGDSQDMSVERPEWARASVVPTPIHSPLPKDVSFSSLTEQSILFIQRSALKDLKEIGEGQFGKIYKATFIQDMSEMTVAVKTIKKYESEQERSDFLQEMRITKGLMHPNIMNLYGIVDEELPWLVLQYFPNGDLKNYLINNEHSVDQLIKYMINVAMGMHYITEKGLVHRDLAARNVMVDDQKTCKVADFGLLREIPKDDAIYQSTTEIPLPIRWMAPESLRDRKFSPASDVWSFGVLLWEMYYPQQIPYAKLGIDQISFQLHSGHRLCIPTAYPAIVARIMKACWQKEPEKRPSFQLISSLLTKFNDFKSEDS